MTVDAPPAPVSSRAGRNLPAAIAVGLSLAAMIVATLFTVRAIFGCVVIGAAVGIGVWELCRAIAGARAAFVPLVAGGPAMVISAYAGGTDALFVAFVVTVLVSLAWLLPEGPEVFLRDATTTLLVVVWVPFLASFAALMTAPPDGPRRVLAFIAVTVCSDVGGYVAGVLGGKHPMAPSVSPKKSWEGFAGSVVMCATGGVVLLPLLFDAAWWQGLLFGLAVVATATLGDLGESLVKRDIGIKDMGSLLPGHGGLMDRLDSLLPTAPVAWLLLSAFA